jgi:hypothetical protein
LHIIWCTVGQGLPPSSPLVLQYLGTEKEIFQINKMEKSLCHIKDIANSLGFANTPWNKKITDIFHNRDFTTNFENCFHFLIWLLTYILTIPQYEFLLKHSPWCHLNNVNQFNQSSHQINSKSLVPACYLFPLCSSTIQYNTIYLFQLGSLKGQ